MKHCRPLLLLLALALLVFSCETDARQKNAQKKEKAEVTIFRYDKLLDDFLRSGSLSTSQKLTMEYRRPTQMLIENVLEIGSVDSDSVFWQLQNFYSDTTLVRLRRDVEKKFADMKPIEKELTKGFRNLQKEMPDVPIPFVYSQVSAFNESIIVVDTLLGISLDKYMGADYPLYKRFYYGYQRNSMRPERIPADSFFYYLMSHYPFR